MATIFEVCEKDEQMTRYRGSNDNLQRCSPDVSLVTKGKTNNDLLEEPKCLGLVQPALVDEIFEKFSPRDVLHDQEPRTEGEPS